MAELNPTVQGIIDKLPEALQDLQTAETELAAKSGEVVGVAGQQAELERGHEASTAGLTAGHSRKIFEGYSPKLRNIIRHVFAGEDELMQIPPLEDCHRIAEVDGLIASAAGQPVVVLKPGKGWIDAGMLEQPPETDHGEHTGLQLSYSFKSGSAIVLPVRNAVTIDLTTADKPTWEVQRKDEELQHRDILRLGAQPEPVRPVIDPLNTRVLPEGQEPDSEEDTSEMTHVLVGYAYLQQTLNRIYGFGFEAVKGSEDLEDWSRFQAVLRIQKRLEESGIAFDIDFIDGCLAYRIDKLENEMRAGGPFQGTSTPYQEVILNGMKQKLATLTEAGWIS